MRAPERWLGALSLIVIALISLGNVVTRYLTGGSFFVHRGVFRLPIGCTDLCWGVGCFEARPSYPYWLFRARIATSLAWCVDSLSSPCVGLIVLGLDHLVRWQASVAGVPMGSRSRPGLRGCPQWVGILVWLPRAVGGHAVALVQQTHVIGFLRGGRSTGDT